MTITETTTATAVLIGGNAATFGRALVNVSKCASTDQTRGVLAGVHVSFSTEPDPETGNKTLILTASDSYRLIQASIPLTDNDTVAPFDPFVIDAKQAIKAAKLITRKNVDNGIGFTVTGPTFTLSTADGSANVEIRTGNYPDMSAVLNPEHTGELPRFDADLMSGLLDAMSGVISTGNHGHSAVTLETVGGMRKPMLLSGFVPDVARVVGVIMPLRK